MACRIFLGKVLDNPGVGGVGSQSRTELGMRGMAFIKLFYLKLCLFKGRVIDWFLSRLGQIVNKNLQSPVKYIEYVYLLRKQINCHCICY